MEPGGNYHIGVFNCDPDPKIKMFDEESDWTIQDWYASEAYTVMCGCPFTYVEYDDEQKNISVNKVTAKDRQEWWNELDENEKNAIKALPNFNADKFYLCTQIDIREASPRIEMSIEEAIRRIVEHNHIHERKEPRAVYISKALDMATDIMRKYQKIEQIMKNHDNDKMSEDYQYLDKIREVL